MKDTIAYCGLDCEKCDAYVATVNNDDALRERTAKLWAEANCQGDIVYRLYGDMVYRFQALRIRREMKRDSRRSILAIWKSP